MADKLDQDLRKMLGQIINQQYEMMESISQLAEKGDAPAGTESLTAINQSISDISDRISEIVCRQDHIETRLENIERKIDGRAFVRPGAERLQDLTTEQRRQIERKRPSINLRNSSVRNFIKGNIYDDK